MAVRDRPLAADPPGGRHQDRHPGDRRTPGRGRVADEPVESRLPRTFLGRRPGGERSVAGARHPVGARAVPAEPDVPARRVAAGPGSPGRSHHRAPGVARAPPDRRRDPGSNPPGSRRRRLRRSSGEPPWTAGAATSPIWPASPRNSRPSTSRPRTWTGGSPNCLPWRSRETRPRLDGRRRAPTVPATTMPEPPTVGEPKKLHELLGGGGAADHPEPVVPGRQEPDPRVRRPAVSRW